METIDILKHSVDIERSLVDTRNRTAKNLKRVENVILNLALDYLEPTFREHDQWIESYRDKSKLYINSPDNIAVEVPCHSKRPQVGFSKEIYTINLREI